MKKREQLMQVGELGAAAFHAGKYCSPARDKDFLMYLSSCGDRKVGATPAGEASTLDMLNAWIQHWQMASQAKSHSHQPELSSTTGKHPW